MRTWAKEHKKLCGLESSKRFIDWHKHPEKLDDPAELRKALLDFIADFANWDNSTNATYLEVSRALTQAAHEALGGEPGTRPLVVDPFAGGGSIPLEALRVGADAFASDLNPVAVLLNKVVLEYIPKYGQRLADEVRKWGQWVKEQAEKELAQFYPKDPDGATPIAYLWARTIRCGGPGCGAEIPLLNQLVISKRRRVAARLKVSGSRIDVDVVHGDLADRAGEGTVRKAKILCPVCGFTTSADSYRAEARSGRLGDRLYCVVLATPTGERKYRKAERSDLASFELARERITTQPTQYNLPVEKLSLAEPRRLNVLHYGFDIWSKLFNPRQQVSMATLSKVVADAHGQQKRTGLDPQLAVAVTTILGLAISNIVQYNCTMSTWLSDGQISVFIQSSSIPMRADYAECCPLVQDLVGGLDLQFSRVEEMLHQAVAMHASAGTATQSSATRAVLPRESVDLVATDPPYYFAIPYAELSDFFFVWIRRMLAEIHPALTGFETTPKADEAIQNLPHSKGVAQKDRNHFEDKIRQSLVVAEGELRKGGVAVVVFAHASTEGWESLLNALLQAGWCITGSWPIDTEREGRMLASRQSVLASSVHLVCRPRVVDQDAPASATGEWRDVLGELPKRVHDWLVRLDKEGVHGADAIFACLGPALEIFSRYSRVEKSDGSQVTLREYLEHVWAAVSKEALALLFKDADSGGLEPDARLTAMWMWTLNPEAGNGKPTGKITGKVKPDDEPDETDSDEPDDADNDEKNPAKGKGKQMAGFVLEYDAARKIAQGLGIHLEKLPNLVEVKGDKARLLSVAERVKTLFGKATEAEAKAKKAKKQKGATQTNLFAEIQQAEADAGKGFDVEGPKPGTTVLDRVHQAMLLFGAQRSDALKRFLVDDGAGKDAAFWKLADTLVKLYPKGTDERRWSEGVVARKKGLGL